MNQPASPAIRRPKEGWRLFMLLGGLFMNGLVPMPMVPGMPAMARELGGGYDGQLIAQMVMAVPGFMLVVGGLAAGPLVTWFGKRAVIQAAVTSFALFGLLGLIAPNLPVLFAGRLMVGASAGCCASVIVSLIGDYYDSIGRVRVLGWGSAVGGIASSGSLILSGVLVDHFGWRAPFVIYAISLLMLLAVHRVVAPRGAYDPAALAARAPMPFRTVAPQWYLYVLLTISCIALFTMSTQGPFLLQAIDIKSATAQGMILSASTLASVLSATFAFKLRRHLQPVTMLMISLGGLGVWLIACGMVRGVVAITAMDVMVGLFGGFAVPTFKGLILDKTAEPGRTLAAGLMTGAIFGGQALAPFVINPLSRLFDVQGAFIAVGAVFAAGVACLLLYRLARSGATAQPAE
jgi:MFS family permease